MKSILSLALLPFLFSCSAISAPPSTQAKTSNLALQAAPTSLPQLTAAEKIKVGKQIWKNESGGKVSGLTHWNDGEAFPSIGIGHFIWYPKGVNEKFEESFPAFVQFARGKNTQGELPGWLLVTPDCPWQTKAAFYKDFDASRLKNLRAFLSNNVELQTDFIIQRSRQALQKIISAAPQQDRAEILANYSKVASTPNGTYALIDYVNFKGDGTKAAERYNGKGWGLLQVLTHMRSSSGGQDSARAFSESAKAMLLRRVKNSPSSRGESRWTAGWNNRCDTYAKPF